MTRLRGVAVGAGYFSRYHFEAWQRIPEVELVALCDRDQERGSLAARQYGVPKVHTDVETMLDEERPDFIDIITPPDTHLTICRLAGERGIHVLCQKALAPTLAEAVALVRAAERSGIRLMVHDNFRFQPWHRELRRLIEADAVGRVHFVGCRTRMGDGWGKDAYLARQPYFQQMPRLLVFETGVHFIDVFRFLVGEVSHVFARLRRLNPVIAGEDCGVILFEFAEGATGIWDANRYNESLSADPRYTFGEFLIEGERGSLRVAEDGQLLVHPLGETPRVHEYVHQRRGFAGDCCHAAIRHFVDGLRTGRTFETTGGDYLKTLAVQEAAYESSRTGGRVAVQPPDATQLTPAST